MRFAHRSSKGFTLTEMTLVAGLMSLLVVLLSGAWSGFGRPSVEAVARCRVAQEATLALWSFAHDFSGNLPEQATGTRQSGRLVGWLVVDHCQIWLCFDGEPADGLADWGAPDTVIVYEVSDNRLVRTNQQTKTAVVIADGVELLECDDRVDEVLVRLTCRHSDWMRTYTIVARVP